VSEFIICWVVLDTTRAAKSHHSVEQCSEGVVDDVHSVRVEEDHFRCRVSE
jgi:hypothetical protein